VENNAAKVLVEDWDFIWGKTGKANPLRTRYTTETTKIHWRSG